MTMGKLSLIEADLKQQISEAVCAYLHSHATTGVDEGDLISALANTCEPHMVGKTTQQRKMAAARVVMETINSLVKRGLIIKRGHKLRQATDRTT